MKVTVDVIQDCVVAGSCWTKGFKGDVDVTADVAAELEKAGLVAKPAAATPMPKVSEK